MLQAGIIEEHKKEVSEEILNKKTRGHVYRKLRNLNKLLNDIEVYRRSHLNYASVLKGIEELMDDLDGGADE